MEEVHKKLLDDFYLNAKTTFNKITEKNLKGIVSLIVNSKKIFVFGIGHSGMFGKILSMKLNHLGLKAYTVFDEINPPFDKDDLFIAISQSGETKTIISLVQKAKNFSGKVLGLTSNANSTLVNLSDEILIIEKLGKDIEFSALPAIGDKKNQNLLGALFGFNIYVLSYTLIIMLAKELKETPESINKRHANLQ